MLKIIGIAFALFLSRIEAAHRSPIVPPSYLYSQNPPYVQLPEPGQRLSQIRAEVSTQAPPRDPSRPLLCDLRCDEVYSPVCVKDADSRIQEFTNYCHLRAFNCKHKSVLTPNTQCSIQRFRHTLEERIYQLQKYYSGSPYYQTNHYLSMRRFMDALKDLMKYV